MTRPQNVIRLIAAGRRYGWSGRTVIAIALTMTRAALCRHLALGFLRPRRPVRLDLTCGPVWLGADTFVIDAITFWDIFVTKPWPMPDTRFHDRFTVDVGAHRGYFGAFALHCRARGVLSLEPHPHLFTCLARSSDEAQMRGGSWRAARLAAGATSGLATLNLSGESWAHSLMTPVRADSSTAIEVPMERFDRVLDDVVAEAGPGLVVKLNIEGAAGAVVLSTDHDHWLNVDELLLSHEPNTPEPFADLVRHLSEAGLKLQGSKGENHWFSRPSGKTEPGHVGAGGR